MGSINAENVAKDVLETIRKGEKVVLGKIIQKNGYSVATSTVPPLVTRTKSYQKVIDPVAKRWIRLRDKLTKELERKDLAEESMRDITDTIDKLTKNIQLVTGGATANVAVMGVEINVRKDSAIHDSRIPPSVVGE